MGVEALHKLVDIKSANEEHDAASKVAQRAWGLAEEVGDKRGQVSSLLLVTKELVTLLARGGNKGSRLERATKAARDAVATARNLNDDALVASALASEAQVMLLGDSVREAQQSSAEALRLFRQMEDVSGEAVALILRAESWLAQQEAEKAWESAFEAVGCAQACSDDYAESQAMDVLKRAELKTSKAAASLDVSSSARLVMPNVVDKIRKLVGTVEDLYDDAPLMQAGLTKTASAGHRQALAKQYTHSIKEYVHCKPVTLSTNPSVEAASVFMHSENFDMAESHKTKGPPYLRTWPEDKKVFVHPAMNSLWKACDLAPLDGRPRSPSPARLAEY